MKADADEWRKYKADVLSRVGDFSGLFQTLRKQKPGGDGWVTACCAFHDDKNPSFAYNRQTGKWACFAGCGKGGPLDFIMQTTGWSFKDALFSLGDKVGVPKPGSNGSKSERIDEAWIGQLAAALEANEKVKKYLREKRGLTDATRRKYELGWDAHRERLAIPVRDEKGRLVNVRLYSPSRTPKMLNLKGHGHTPRLYGADELAKYEGREIILCEGEFDRLILQQNGFTAVTSTHGCASFRREWLAIFDGKDVVVGYDADSEGQAAVQGIVLPALRDAKAASLKNLVLPLPGTKDDKDFTDFFVKPRSMNGNLFEKRCYTPEELRKLIDAAPPVDLGGVAPKAEPGGRKAADLMLVIKTIRESEGLGSHQKFTNIAEALALHLGEGGAFFYDPRASAEYLCLDGRVYTLGNNRAFNALLQRLGRMNVTTAEGRFAWEFLRNHARDAGRPVRSVGWVHADADKLAVFVHTHNDQGDILKISPGAVTLVPNGQNDDKVMLSPSDRVKPFRYLENADRRPAWALFKRLLHDAFPCAPADKAILAAVVPLVFLKDLCPARPLIRLSGSSESGKTTAGKLIGYAVYGEDIAKTGTIASFYTDASRNPLAMIDNLEVPNMKGELLDFLLTGATGIVHEKKKLYTDQDIVREKAEAFILTTGIESLGKPELLSRQWDLACGEPFHSKGFSHLLCMNEIFKHRDEILSAVFDLLAHDVLPRLDDRYKVEAMLRRDFKGHPKERTFECLALAFLIWDALEDKLGLERELWSQWLGAQRSESEETSAETNVVLQFLNLFAGAARALKAASGDKTRAEFIEQFQLLPADDDPGVCFDAGAGQLLHLFTALAKQHGYPRPFENAKQLMARVKEALTVIKAAGWAVEFKVRTVNGQRVHRFRLADDGDRQGALPGVGT